MRRRDFIRTFGFGLAAGVATRAWGQAAGGGQAPTTKPNILLILADDMGYSDAGCYGGEIETPNLDALAAGGVRFTQHYSTGRCWPSRSCIMTGYYAQHIRRDGMPGIKGGGGGKRPPWAPLLPQYLQPLGYHAYHSGKWHVDGLPTANGYERSWGSGGKNSCDDNRFFSSGRWQEDDLHAPVEPGEPYYSTIAIADHAIACLKLHKRHHGDAPFFQYVAFYSPHFPLMALPEDIDRYRDTYPVGWDIVRERRLARMKKMGLVNCELSARQETIVPPWNLSPEQLRERIGEGEVGRAVAWDTLSDVQKRFQATKMAIHAAMVHRMDAEIGRIVAQLKEMGVYENTVIMFASDNGASAEQIIRGDGYDPDAPMGSAKSFLCLGPGWATAANTPFRLHKHWNHEGGISSPFIVHWPKGIAARGELRHDPTHFVDVLPTAVALAGGEMPGEYNGIPMPAKPGMSLVSEFQRDGSLPERTLWWCHSGNQAIRIGNWKLTMRRDNGDRWELYDLTHDRGEMQDLARKYPERVKTMAEKWESYGEAFRRDLTATKPN